MPTRVIALGNKPKLVLHGTEENGKAVSIMEDEGLLKFVDEDTGTEEWLQVFQHIHVTGKLKVPAGNRFPVPLLKGESLSGEGSVEGSGVVFGWCIE